MYIYPKSTGPIRPETTSQPPEVTEAGSVGPIGTTSTGTDRSDKVQISDAGRALAARDGQETQQATSLTSDRSDQIRNRVLSGAYDTLEVVDTVARRILGSGDL